MRVEATPFVFRSEDRRQRREHRAASDDRRALGQDRRVRAVSTPWLTAGFAAQILGQAAPLSADRWQASRSFVQPDSRTPLRPRQTLLA